MKLPWDNIKLILALILILGLVAFTNHRNGERDVVVNESIMFENEEDLFINHQSVNKLLIQKTKHVRNLHKDALVLNKLEDTLNKHPMIQNAEVYLSVNGKLGVKIKQKTPIARVMADESFYIDDRGNRMPLSENYSARVILVTGKVVEKNYSSIQDLASFMLADDFLKKHFVEMHFKNEDEVVLKTRSLAYKVNFGTIENIKKKFRNYKAFYLKLKKDNTLGNFKTVNLEFNNQVVCTKK